MRSLALALAVLPSAAVAAPARAQSEPDAGVAAVAAEQAAAQPEEEEEQIDDPELAGVPHAAAPDRADGRRRADTSDTTLRTELATRFGVDTAWDRQGEDVWEARQRALLEVEHRSTSRLRFAAGVQLKHLWAAPREDDGGLDRDRFEIDVWPSAAYVDATIADGLHARVGYQVISMGRMDLWSASDVLAVYDLRWAMATTDTSSLQVAEPAVRVDYDIASWLTLQAVYVPWLEPHRVALLGGDPSLLDALAGPGAAATAEAIDQYVDPSHQGPLSAALARSLAPEPSFAHPQAALRLEARHAAGAVALTAGTALEKLPAVTVTDTFAAFLAAPAMDTAMAVQADLAVGIRPFEVAYDRFYVVALDGALDLGPIQAALEVAYTPERTLYAVAPASMEVPHPERTGLAQIAARAEWIEGEEYFASIEAFLAAATDDPSTSGEIWVGLESAAIVRGAMAMARYRPGEGAWMFELAGLVSSGPSILVLPRIEWRVTDGVYVELGATFVEGPADDPATLSDASFGSFLDHTDQVFVGARWLP